MAIAMLQLTGLDKREKGKKGKKKKKKKKKRKGKKRLVTVSMDRRLHGRQGRLRACLVQRIWLWVTK